MPSTATDSASGSAQCFSLLLAAAGSECPYHVLVLDGASFDLDPLQFAAAVRAQPALKDLSLVLVGPKTNEAPHEELLRSGYACMVPTPLDKTLLFNALHAASASPVGEPRVARLIDRYAGARGPVPALDILVAEDNPTNQKVIKKILERSGHRIYLVENGEQALDALEEHRFDLAIMDMQMPEMGGIQAIKLFRFTHLDRQDMPFIVLSANAMTEAAQECEDARIDAYLTKPVEAKRLLETVANVYADKQAATFGGKGPVSPTLAVRDTASDAPILPTPNCSNSRNWVLIAGSSTICCEVSSEMRKSCWATWSRRSPAVIGKPSAIWRTRSRAVPAASARRPSPNIACAPPDTQGTISSTTPRRY